MELNVKIISNNGKIIIKDNTKYLKDSESDNGFRNYRKSDVIQLDIVTYDQKLSTIDIQNPIQKLINIPIQKDGKLIISHLVIPTRKWFERLNSGNVGSSYKLVFYYDNGKFYKTTPDINQLYKDPKEISISDLINENLNDSNILMESITYISIWFLKKCYINLCNQIFNQRAFSKCWNNKIDKELIYKRDLLWMALNVIKYLTHIDEIDEAQRIIELMNGCNGLCKSSNTTIKNCGCNK